MGRKILYACIALFLPSACVHVSQREPENYRNLVRCKSAADHDRTHHREKVLECASKADAFIKSQETYKLNQEENLEAFNAVYGVYFYQKDRGARGLEEIFSRFEEGNRTRDMAANVLRKYVIERNFVHAAEFVETYPQYNLEALPRVTGQARAGKTDVFHVTGKNSVHCEPFILSTKPSIIVVFEPSATASYDLHRYLTSQKNFQNVLLNTTYLIPQDALLNSELLSWIRKNPSPRARIVYKEEPFLSLVPDWSGGPKVYFYENSELRYTIPSWAKSSPREFLEGLQAVKLKN